MTAMTAQDYSKAFRKDKFYTEFNLLINILVKDEYSVSLVKDLINYFEHILTEIIQIKSARKKKDWICKRLSQLLTHRLYGYHYYLESYGTEYFICGKTRIPISDLLINCHEGYAVIVLIYIYFYFLYANIYLNVLDILDILKKFAVYKFTEFQILGRTNVMGFESFIKGYIKYLQIAPAIPSLTDRRYNTLVDSIIEQATEKHTIDKFIIMYNHYRFSICRFYWVSAVIRMSIHLK